MKFLVRKPSGDVEVLLLPFKGTNSFSFVNLTRGHICPCVFDSAEDALRDVEGGKSRGLLDSYEVVADEQNHNAPLTLDELREMDGEPVWVRSINDSEKDCWSFVEVERSMVRVIGRGMVGLRHFKTYGKTWLAYRRKPEATHWMPLPEPPEVNAT